eukprot:1883539-Amphidinium_carterae.1
MWAPVLSCALTCMKTAWRKMDSRNHTLYDAFSSSHPSESLLCTHSSLNCLFSGSWKRPTSLQIMSLLLCTDNHIVWFHVISVPSLSSVASLRWIGFSYHVDD